MEIETFLGPFLKSLCDNSQWTYAVFWKFEQPSRVLLTWGGGYYGNSKPREYLEKFFDEILNNRSETYSKNYETSIRDGSSGGDSIGLAMADMSSLQYTFGEGVVGRVAYTGNHHWVLYDTIVGEFDSMFLSEYPDEWLIQFAAGIKTILLVPVTYGVVQLGSLETVAEDLALVSHMKERFNAIQNIMGCSLSCASNRDLLAQPPTSHIPVFRGQYDKISATADSLVNKMLFEDVKAVDGIKLMNNELPTSNQVTLPSVGQDMYSEREVLQIFGRSTENKHGVLSMSLAKVSSFLNQPTNICVSEMMEKNMLALSCPEDELNALSQCNIYDLGASGEFSIENLDSCPDGDILEELHGNKNIGDAGHMSVGKFFRFPVDCELHKAIGPDFYGQISGISWDSSVSGGGSSSLICNRDLIEGIQESNWESSEWFTEGADAKHLLEAVVTNVYNDSDDATSNLSNSIKLSTTFMGQFAASSHVKAQYQGGNLVGDDFVQQQQVTSSFSDRGRNAFSNSNSASSVRSSVSKLIDDELPKKGHGYGSSKRPQNLSKRKGKPCDNQRPRPRDRQLIQDRVKELRELVPNGAKCSIDGLLDQTIKHMMFLRSVTVQADKLRQWLPEEVASQKKWKSPESSQGHNGTSWAFELGSELDRCPIVVEDLEYPGHLLIEMICNEHGLFLEIAQVIRGLELTILKGVMESRLNNMWAHFVVEASRGFHRMDVFWPLMHLLQRTGSSVSSKI